MSSLSINGQESLSLQLHQVATQGRDAISRDMPVCRRLEHKDPHIPHAFSKTRLRIHSMSL